MVEDIEWWRVLESFSRSSFPVFLHTYLSIPFNFISFYYGIVSLVYTHLSNHVDDWVTALLAHWQRFTEKQYDSCLNLTFSISSFKIASTPCWRVSIMFVIWTNNILYTLTLVYIIRTVWKRMNDDIVFVCLGYILRVKYYASVHEIIDDWTELPM